MPAALPPADSPLLALDDLKDQEQQWQSLMQAQEQHCREALRQRQMQLKQLKSERDPLRIRQEKARAREALAKARVKSIGSTMARRQLERAREQLQQYREALRQLRRSIQSCTEELGHYREALRFVRQRQKLLHQQTQEWRQQHDSERPRRGRPAKSVQATHIPPARSKRQQGPAVALNRSRGRLPLGPQRVPSIFDPLP